MSSIDFDFSATSASCIRAIARQSGRAFQGHRCGALALLMLAACDHAPADPATAIALPGGPDLAMSALTTSNGSHHATLAVDGLDGDVVIWTDAGALHLSQQAAGYDLLLTVDPAGMTLELSDGQNLQRILAQRITERDHTGVLDVLAAAELPARPLSGPFQDNEMHRIALTVLDRASDLDPSLTPFLEDALALTAQLENAMVHASTATLGSQRKREGGPKLSTDVAVPVLANGECEYEVTKRWSAQAVAAALGAGPVSATVSGPKVEGTSMCDVRGSISTSSSNTYTPTYALSGEGGFACPGQPNDPEDWEASYSLSGSMVADAAHNECCRADGATDTAEAGSLSLSVYGNTFSLTASANEVNTDMGSAAHGEISGSAVVCLDTDWLNEAFLMSNTVTTSAWIN